MCVQLFAYIRRGVGKKGGGRRTGKKQSEKRFAVARFSAGQLLTLLFLTFLLHFPFPSHFFLCCCSRSHMRAQKHTHTYTRVHTQAQLSSPFTRGTSPVACCSFFQISVTIINALTSFVRLFAFFCRFYFFYLFFNIARSIDFVFFAFVAHDTTQQYTPRTYSSCVNGAQQRNEYISVLLLLLLVSSFIYIYILFKHYENRTAPFIFFFVSEYVSMCVCVCFCACVCVHLAFVFFRALSFKKMRFRVTVIRIKQYKKTKEGFSSSLENKTK